MVSMFMGQLSGGQVPQSQEAVRSTVDPYFIDKSPAEQNDMPVMQELETDSDPSLVGITGRQMASHWVEGVAAPPEWMSRTDSVTESFNVINRQVGTSGTAAGREADGQVHKNASYAVGIEPVFDLQDPNHRMGNDYFVRTPRGIQEGMDNMMSVPPGYYHQSQQSVIANGAQNARDAYAAGPYSLFWNGGK